MTEVRLEGMKPGAVAFADEACEGLAALMRIQMPGLTLKERQIDEWRKCIIEAVYDGALSRNADPGSRANQPGASHYEPEIILSGSVSQSVRQLLHHFDGALYRLRRDPAMGLTIVAA
ncbi:MAG: hypothetical protein ACLQFI_14630 [Methylocella sp.]